MTVSCPGPLIPRNSSHFTYRSTSHWIGPGPSCTRLHVLLYKMWAGENNTSVPTSHCQDGYMKQGLRSLTFTNTKLSPPASRETIRDGFSVVLRASALPATAGGSVLTAEAARVVSFSWPQPSALSVSYPLFQSHWAHSLSLVGVCLSLCFRPGMLFFVYPLGCLLYFPRGFIQESFQWNLPSTFHFFLPTSFFSLAHTTNR